MEDHKKLFDEANRKLSTLLFSYMRNSLALTLVRHKATGKVSVALCHHHLDLSDEQPHSLWPLAVILMDEGFDVDEFQQISISGEVINDKAEIVSGEAHKNVIDELLRGRDERYP